MKDHIIDLHEIRKIYQMGMEQIRALDNVSISFERGSFWAIMGASGSGKSTMMNLLGCLDRPTSGTYMFGDRDVGSLNDDELSEIRLKNIGFIFQSFNLIPQLSVQENIELPMFYLGCDSHESAERAKGLAEMVGLADRLRHRPAELSGGQQQRVAIARALVNDPPLILADEPTGNLDSGSGKQIMDILTDLHKQKKTIIIITHEPEVADYAGSRIQMHDGKIADVQRTGR